MALEQFVELDSEEDDAAKPAVDQSLNQSIYASIN